MWQAWIGRFATVCQRGVLVRPLIIVLTWLVNQEATGGVCDDGDERLRESCELVGICANMHSEGYECIL
ncbi:hypothetical protein Syun_006992 [Stephania yunnanensis]|uniref:Secreted protein n=1 Tax=Stephania yunnanensis TaxID=152371 RepID=A0AAP0KXY3_9MAGN